MDENNIEKDMIIKNDKIIADLLNELVDGSIMTCDEDGDIDLLEYHDVILRHWLTVNTTIQERFYNFLTAMEDQIYVKDGEEHIETKDLSEKLTELIKDL